MKYIEEMVKFNNYNIKEPTNYLGAILKKKNINGVDFWSINRFNYVKNPMENVDEGIKHKIWNIPTQIDACGVIVCPRIGLDTRVRSWGDKILPRVYWNEQMGYIDRTSLHPT